MLNRQPVSDLRWTCPPGPAIWLVKCLVGMRVGCRLCCSRLTYSAQRFSGLLPHFNDCSNYCGLSGAWWDKCLSCNKSPLRVAFQFDEQERVCECVCVQGVDLFWGPKQFQAWVSNTPTTHKLFDLCKTLFCSLFLTTLNFFLQL